MNLQQIKLTYIELYNELWSNSSLFRSYISLEELIKDNRGKISREHGELDSPEIHLIDKPQCDRIEKVKTRAIKPVRPNRCKAILKDIKYGSKTKVLHDMVCDIITSQPQQIDTLSMDYLARKLKARGVKLPHPGIIYGYISASKWVNNEYYRFITDDGTDKGRRDRKKVWGIKLKSA